MLERTDMRGAVTIELADRAGEVVHRQQRNNRIVASGRRVVAEMFGGATTPSTGKITHVGVGEDGTAPADTQIELGKARGKRIALLTVEYADVSEGAAPDVVARTKVSITAVFDFDQANDKDVPLREAGLFTGATAGVMYNRVTLDPVTKTKDFKLTVLWDVVF